VVRVGAGNAEKSTAEFTLMRVQAPNALMPRTLMVLVAHKNRDLGRTNTVLVDTHPIAPSDGSYALDFLGTGSEGTICPL
jgi:hypothetical protein